MEDFFISLTLFLQTSVQLGTHILFAVLGGIMCEKIGNLNLGIEGMMLLGAAIGFSAALNTGNPFVAVFAAGFAGVTMRLRVSRQVPFCVGIFEERTQAHAFQIARRR